MKHSTATNEARESAAEAIEFEDRFRTHFSRVVYFLEKFVEGTGVDAHDVAQEAMIKAWRHRDRFDAKYSYTTWLYRIARNTVLDHLRHVQRRPSRSLDTDSAIATEALKTVSKFVDEDRSFGDTWETARAVLNERQYSVLWLRYAEEMTVAEIAKSMKLTGIATRALLHRGRKNLANALEAQAKRTDDSIPTRGEWA